MVFIKAWKHIISYITMLIYKIIYGKRLYIGKRTTWRKGLSLMISPQGMISIGENCFFNNYCSINALEKITIGSGCIFGENVRIYDHNHKFRLDGPIKPQGYTYAPISIGNNCWIGSGVIILKGVSIGDHCVIGAGCVVDKDIPASYIVKNESNLKLIKMEENHERKNLSDNGRL
jgi:acetyltransferase-like isoleucine patch superfamily enzyme